ncbi:hypothetical protein BC629DRAFT_884431 [Irpex lacteus]|nr:hypothetical protein BC629DRAFT_884431 [Irpex lacteus]
MKHIPSRKVDLLYLHGVNSRNTGCMEALRSGIAQTIERLLVTYSGSYSVCIIRASEQTGSTLSSKVTRTRCLLPLEEPGKSLPRKDRGLAYTETKDRYRLRTIADLESNLDNTSTLPPSLHPFFLLLKLPSLSQMCFFNNHHDEPYSLASLC